MHPRAHQLLRADAPSGMRGSLSAIPVTADDAPTKLVTEAVNRAGGQTNMRRSSTVVSNFGTEAHDNDEFAMRGESLLRLCQQQKPDMFLFARAVASVVDGGRVLSAALFAMTIQNDNQEPLQLRQVLRKCSQRKEDFKSKTGWKERLVVLKEDSVEYYIKPKTKEEELDPPKKSLKGIIALKNSTTTAVTFPNVEHALEIKTPTGKKPFYFLAFDNPDDLLVWRDGVNAIINKVSDKKAVFVLRNTVPHDPAGVLSQARMLGLDALRIISAFKHPDPYNNPEIELPRMLERFQADVRKLCTKRI
jgi:hypothetical protein